MFVYVGAMAGVYGVGAMSVAVFGQPLLAVLLVYPLAVLLAALLALGCVALLFAFVLRVAGASAYQRIALWMQIAFTALLLSAGQVIPRLRFAREAIESFVGDERLHSLLPPVHLGGLYMLAAG